VNTSFCCGREGEKKEISVRVAEMAALPREDSPLSTLQIEDDLLLARVKVAHLEGLRVIGHFQEKEPSN